MAAQRHRMMGFHLIGVPKTPDIATRTLDRLIDERMGILDCSRCGALHPNLTWRRFERPAPSDRGIYAGWATCPKTTDPILYEIPDTPHAEMPPGGPERDETWPERRRVAVGAAILRLVLLALLARSVWRRLHC